MNAFSAALAMNDSIENEADVLGGGNGPWESGIYPAEITMAFLSESNSGAFALNVWLKNDNGQEMRQTIYMTSGRAKGQKNYYERDGQMHYLPGFNVANSIALLTLGKNIGEVETVERVVSIYNFESRSEEPTKVECFVELIGQRALFGVQKQIDDKRTLDESTGKYVPTGETRELNEIDKVFRIKDKLTTMEIRAGVTEPNFHDNWLKKWEGVTRDRSEGGSANSSGKPQAKALSGGGQPKKSLFATS